MLELVSQRVYAQASLLLFVAKVFCSLPGHAFAKVDFLANAISCQCHAWIAHLKFCQDERRGRQYHTGHPDPKIILAGVISLVEGFARILARLIITGYWGYQGLVSLLPTDLLERLPTDDCSAFGAFCVVFLHVLIFTGGALAVLYFRDMSRPTREAMVKKLLAKGRLPTA